MTGMSQALPHTDTSLVRMGNYSIARRLEHTELVYKRSTNRGTSLSVLDTLYRRSRRNTRLRIRGAVRKGLQFARQSLMHDALLNGARPSESSSIPVVDDSRFCSEDGPLSLIFLRDEENACVLIFRGHIIGE